MISKSITQTQLKLLANNLRNGSVNLGKLNYALSLIHSVDQALMCGIGKITIIELGVGGGTGLLTLSKSAECLSSMFGIEFEIYGFDTGNGMPPSVDYRDHPELWKEGDFKMPRDLPIKLPPNVKLMLGNIKETIPNFVKDYSGSPIGFVAIDVDYYSSTVNSMPLFEMPEINYLPAMPVYVDDVNTILSYSPWTGEALALSEFNQTHELRKFEEKHRCWGIDNFYVFHVFDHPIRTGTTKPKEPLNLYPY